jgi:hypothetical protein
VHLKNLGSGTVRTVATNVQVVENELYLHGQVVGWNAYASGTKRIGSYRDMSTGAAAVTLPDIYNVWQMSDAGAVLESAAGTGGDGNPSFPGPRNLRLHTEVLFYLQAYNSTSRAPMLAAHFAQVGPELAGGVLAWVDQHGRLRAETFK